MASKKKTNKAGIGMAETEMAAISKRIADVIAGKIMEAVVEKFKDAKSNDLCIPFGDLFADKPAAPAETPTPAGWMPTTESATDRRHNCDMAPAETPTTCACAAMRSATISMTPTAAAIAAVPNEVFEALIATDDEIAGE